MYKAVINKYNRQCIQTIKNLQGGNQEKHLQRLFKGVIVEETKLRKADLDRMLFNNFFYSIFPNPFLFHMKPCVEEFHVL